MACLSWVKREEKPERGPARQGGLQAAEFSPDAPWRDATLPSLPPHGLPGAHFSTDPDSLLQPAAPHDEPPPWEGEFDPRNHPPKENSQPPRSPQPPMPWGALAAIADQAPGQFVAARATEAGAAVINGERWILPTGEQVLAELAANSVPGVGGHGHGSAHGETHVPVGGEAHASGKGEPSRQAHSDSGVPNNPNGPKRGGFSDAGPPAADRDHPPALPEEPFFMSQSGGNGQPDNNNPDPQMFDENKISPKGKAQLARLRAVMDEMNSRRPRATFEEAVQQLRASRISRGLKPLNNNKTDSSISSESQA